MRGAQDAHDAKNYLAQLSFIDKNKIAVLGWSYGAGVAIKSIYKSTEIKNRDNPFKAAIAFYPYCYAKLEGFESPLLILIGELDKMTPAALCKQMVSKTSMPEVVLKTYPGAQHSFDRFKLARDAVADSVVQVKSFLTKHMQ
jgi:dienelactone hydrolase